METKKLIKERVRKYYWQDDINCATTTLKILAEKFDLELSDQVIEAATGMHGAGEYGAQCGLVEGTLMFLGILGRKMNVSKKDVINACNNFAGGFEKRFKSLLCNVLRPEGFSSDNPPHLCEGLTCEAMCFNIQFVANFRSKHGDTTGEKQGERLLSI